MVLNAKRQPYGTINVSRPLSAYSVPVAVVDPGPDGRLVLPTMAGRYRLQPDGRVFERLACEPDHEPARQQQRDYTWEIRRRNVSAPAGRCWPASRRRGATSRPGTGNDFSPNALINAPGSQDRFRTWQAKLNGTINLRWGFLVVPVVRHQSGTPFARRSFKRSTMGARRSKRNRSRPIGRRHHPRRRAHRENVSIKACVSWDSSTCTTCSTPILYRRSRPPRVARGCGRPQSRHRASSESAHGCNGSDRANRSWASVKNCVRDPKKPRSNTVIYGDPSPSALTRLGPARAPPPRPFPASKTRRTVWPLNSSVKRRRGVGQGRPSPCGTSYPPFGDADESGSSPAIQLALAVRAVVVVMVDLSGERRGSSRGTKPRGQPLFPGGADAAPPPHLHSAARNVFPRSCGLESVRLYAREEIPDGP